MLKEIKLTNTVDYPWVDEFISNHLRPMEELLKGSEEFPLGCVQEAFRLGLFQLPGPKTLGGQDLEVSALIWLMRSLSAASPSFGAIFIGNLLGLSAMMLYASEDLKKKELSLKRLNSLWSFAMTEGDIGSDLQNIRTSARRTQSGFVLNGEKNFITNASYSEQMCVFAREIDEKGNDVGISCFFVDGSLPGVKRGKIYSKTAWKHSNTAALLFENVELGAESRLGLPGHGLRILTHCLNRSKTLLAAMGVGLADRALELAINRLEETERFGKALLEQPALRHLLARESIQKEAAWLLTAKAASTWDENLDATLESSMAKHFSGKMATNLISEMIELFGARGLFNDYEISGLWNDAKAIDIIEGPSLVQELLIARRVLPVKKKDKNDLFVLRSEDLKKVAS